MKKYQISAANEWIEEMELRVTRKRKDDIYFDYSERDAKILVEFFRNLPHLTVKKFFELFPKLS